MRGGFRIRHREEEEESAFVSMTDMTVSFLFIIMLLLAFFASQYSEQDNVPRKDLVQAVQERDAALQEIGRLTALLKESDMRIVSLNKSVADQQAEIARLATKTDSLVRENTDLKSQIDKLHDVISELRRQIAELKKADPLETYLQMSALERRRILETLRDQLKIEFPDLQVVVSEETDALRFQGDGLFASGSSVLRPDRKPIIDDIAKRLALILPCYTIGTRSAWNHDCNPSNAIIEALQIEGHTDSNGSDVRNLNLSTDRANTTFVTMTTSQPGLVDFRNFRGQPVLSVAGYGKMRPVADNSTEQGRNTNRRVDLRIIMYTPSKSAEIDRIREALEHEKPPEVPK